MVEPEVAFAELPDLLTLAENMTVYIVECVLGKHRSDLEELGRDISKLENIRTPFPRITYSEAVEMLCSKEIKEHLNTEMETDTKKLEAWKTQLGELEDSLKHGQKKWKIAKIEEHISELTATIKKMAVSLQNRPAHIADATSFEWGRDLGADDETINSTAPSSSPNIPAKPRPST
jgi:asparaginyl-tRNA synthetase